MRSTIGCTLLAGVLLLLSVGPAEAYNILAVDMGAYWNDLFDQYIGAQAGSGAPGAAGERWYTTVHYSGLGAVDLDAYDVLLVQSGFLDDYVVEEATGALEALSGHSGAIRDFVAGGGGLVAWSEPFPDGPAHAWDWAPVDLTSRGIFHDDLVEVADPLHPVMARSTDASLSGWDRSWHGWFESWDPRLEVLAQTGDYGTGDPRTGRALTLAGTYDAGGCGRMVFSMQDPDYHNYQGWDGARTFTQDALDWAGTCAAPIPEPSTVALFGFGIAALAFTAVRRSGAGGGTGSRRR